MYIYSTKCVLVYIQIENSTILNNKAQDKQISGSYTKSYSEIVLRFLNSFKFYAQISPQKSGLFFYPLNSLKSTVYWIKNA